MDSLPLERVMTRTETFALLPIPNVPLTGHLCASTSTSTGHNNLFNVIFTVSGPVHFRCNNPGLGSASRKGLGHVFARPVVFHVALDELPRREGGQEGELPGEDPAGHHGGQQPRVRSGGVPVRTFYAQEVEAGGLGSQLSPAANCTHLYFRSNRQCLVWNHRFVNYCRV